MFFGAIRHAQASGPGAGRKRGCLAGASLGGHAPRAASGLFRAGAGTPLRHFRRRWAWSVGSWRLRRQPKACQRRPAEVGEAGRGPPRRPAALDSLASPLELEQDVQGKVDSFRARIAQEAEDLVSTFFPQKLSELDSRVQELRLQDLSRIRSVPALEPAAVPDPAGDTPNPDPPPPLQPQSSPKVPALPAGGERQLLRSNQHLVELIERVKPEIELLREKCNTVRMWVQLLIPKVEDGDSFGVSIQEDTVDQLWTVESTAASYLRRFSTYYNTRAKLVSKIVKYPQVEDYRRTVAEVDENEYLSMHQILLHVRNQYATLHDVILKNIDKIKTPRSTNTDNLY
ncbi:proteasome activator complex subunit 3-like [Mustela erminea]|uniref:proteasome activator complex subunit 3-like n=1 Tax=Mustela erminea TaxID=36723 RepID=UPI001387305E|nr:proteasome activator complex subunit 3-like [Mustela erminea]